MPYGYGEDLGRYVLNRYKQLTRERLPLESIWQDAFEYSYPLRGQRFQNRDDDFSSTAWNAEQDKAILYDTTGKDSCRLLASSVLSGLTPPNMQWFNLVVPELAQEETPRDAKEWLQDSSKKLFKMIHASNYDAEAYEFMIDMIVGGQAGLFCDYIEGEGFKFEFWPLETLYVSETLKRGRIDTVYRRLLMSAQQVKDKFGAGALTEAMKAQLEAGFTAPENKRHTIIHCIMPRMKNGKQAKGIYKKTLPWMSVWVDKDTGSVLGEGGFHEFPVIIPRWHKIPEADYAFGPFDDALPDVKTLNQVVKLQLTHADFAIAGMFVATDDGVLNPNTVKIKPRGFLFAANPDNVKPLTAPGDFGISSSEIERLQRNIRRVMMSDQLQPQDGPAMTATEVHVRMQIVRQLLGPVYGRFNAEYLTPLIERTFGLAYRAGMFGEAPESLGEERFVPSYSSPLARAQKQEDVTAMNQYELALGQQAQIKPEVLDLYDWDLASRRRADLLGVPVELLKDERKVRREREEREQQMQEAQMAAMAAEQG